MMSHKHKLLISHRSRTTLVFVCEIHWCDIELHTTRGCLRQMTVKGRPWRNQFKRGGNYPLLKKTKGKAIT